MNINRYNYEEYFLLYVDGELSAGERRAVEAFVEQHPDLEEELSMLKQSMLKPDASVVMEDKSSLFKSESSAVITLENYETYFVLYVDEELNAAERREVEIFVSNHPSLQQELNLLMQTRVQPDESIIFQDKNALYKVPAIGQKSQLKLYRLVAVAAMLLIAAGIFWLMPHGNGASDDGGIVAKKQETGKNPGKVAAENNNEKKSQQQSAQQQVAQSEKHIGSAEQTKEIARGNEDSGNKRHVQSGMEGEDSLVAFEPPVVDDSEIHRAVVASVDAPAMSTTGIGNLASKTIIVDHPIDQSKTKTTAMITKFEDDPTDEGVGPVQTKNKFRGFFRQVKRVVEKTTRVPGDENKKLLIGNIEIALK